MHKIFSGSSMYIIYESFFKYFCQKVYSIYMNDLNTIQCEGWYFLLKKSKFFILYPKIQILCKHIKIKKAILY